MQRSRVIDLAIIISFGLIITAPLLLSRHFGSVLATAARSQSDLPSIDRQLNSAFPASHLLTKLYYEIRWEVFHRIHDSVQLGKDRWLFFKYDIWHQSSFQDVLGTNRATAQDRLRWRKTDLRRLAWAQALHLRLLTLIPPNKEDVYQEFLPDEIQARAGGETRMDAMLQTLCAVDPQSALDLRPALAQAKAQGQAYERTDTHWTQWGAYCAYRAILERLGPDFPGMVPIPPDALMRTSVVFAGDLSRLAWLEDVYTERSPRLVAVRRFPAVFASGAATLGPDAAVGQWPKDRPRIVITTTPDPSLPTAVICHDSFAIRLLPYLSQHFRRIVWNWGPLDRDLVEREHPDLVILESTERYLDKLDRE